MPKFEIELPHGLPVDEVRSRLGAATGKLERTYGTSCTWKGERELAVSRKGLTGTVLIEETRLLVLLELGLVLTPLAGPIRAGITRELSGLLLGESPAG